jgi:hypothetical protein
MPTARGISTKAALRREPLVYTRTWPAGTPGAANALIPFLQESVREVPDRVSPPVVWPGAYETAPRLHGKRTSGDLTLQLTYEGIEQVWAMALGHQAKRYGGTVFPQQLAVGAYKHRFEVAADLWGHGWLAGLCGFRAGDGLTAGQRMVRRGTLVVDKSVSAWEAKSCMVGSLELEAAPDGLALSLGLVGHSLSRASGINPNLTGLEDPDLEPVEYHDLEFRLGAQSASTALDSSTAFQVSGLRLSLDNRLGAPMTPHTAPYLDEPARVGKAVVQGRLNLPRYTADTLLTWCINGTTLMASCTWTGPQIAATGQNFALTLWLPHVVIEDVEAPTQGPQRQQLAVAFRAFAPTITCAGFPTTVLSGPLVVEVVSALATNPLLAA